MLPSLTAMRAFDAAARLGSFKAAATELHVSPTAISHHIRGLEEVLQVSLFTRGVRKITLTEAGKRLASSTAQAFIQIEQSIREISSEANVLTISATPAFASLWLAPRLVDFEAAHPDLSVQLLSSTQRVNLSHERGVDLALRYGPLKSVPTEGHFIVTEQFGAYASPQYLEKLEAFPCAGLVETKWMSKDLTPISWENWCSAAGEEFEQVAYRRQFGHEQEVLQAGLSGGGLIIISNLLAKDAVEKGWLVPYREDISLPGYAYWAEMRAAGEGPRKIQKFLKWLQESFA